MECSTYICDNTPFAPHYVDFLTQTRQSEGGGIGLFLCVVSTHEDQVFHSMMIPGMYYSYSFQQYGLCTTHLHTYFVVAVYLVVFSEIKI